jgi:hypothetical protein
VLYKLHDMRKPVRIALVSAAVLLLAEEELKNPIVHNREISIFGPFCWHLFSGSV